MTSSHRQFRRPAPGADDDAPLPHPSSSATRPGGTADPGRLIPDMGFDQEVWNPGSLSSHAHVTEKDGGPTDSAAAGWHPLSRTGVGLALCVLGVAVLGAAVLLSTLHSLTPDSVPLVVDMPIRPSIAWSAGGGDVCAPLDEDHAILSGTDRVWSVDLRDGRTRWSVALSARSPVIRCLSGTNLVSITEGTAAGTVLAVTLLDGSTGREVAKLPGESTVQVIPMGSHLGLLGPENVLSMVLPNRLDSTIWSRRLSGPTGQLDQISVHHIDDSVVQLSYSVIARPGEPSPQLSEILSIHDGEPPAWVDDPALDQAALIHRAFYSQVGDVILHNDGSGHASRLVALNRQGRELWSREGAGSTVVGSRLFLSSHENWEGWSQLHEVDPMSGSPVNDKVFDQTYRYAMTIAGGRLLIAQENTLSILDEHMQPRSSVPSTGLRFLLQGSEQLFLGTGVNDHGDGQRFHVTAIDAESLHEVWTLELAPGQGVEQMGRHLVLVDIDGQTIHGLQSP